MRETLLAIHIAAGSAGLVLGPIAMFSAKRLGRHTRSGDLYFWAYVVLVVAAFGLAATNWDEDWFLVPIGAFSFAFALLGSPLIAYVNTQIALGRRPKGRPDLTASPSARSVPGRLRAHG